VTTVGLLTLELRIEHSHSLKEKRQVIRSLKDRLRARFNVATAELDGHDSWQHAVIGVVTLSKDRPYVEQLLEAVEREASRFLGAALVSADLELL
jgi:hypothetical protein